MTVAEMILSNIENGNIEEVKEFFQMAISDGIMETNEIDDEIPSKLLEEKEITEENIDYLQKLNSLIGLDMIKRQVIKLENYLKFRDKVSQQILLEQLNLNMVFMGNPGTGKTSVARIMANMFYKMGYAKKNMVAELTVRDFVAEYVGQTAIKTQKVLNKYKGGVIFIDEAYVFCSDGQEFGDEALVEIIKEMEKRETIFIFAGYKDEMEKFIKMNPGLQSRIGYHLEFPDYTLDELYAIFLRKVKMSKLYIADEMGAKVKLLISDFMKKKHFGNGCFIDNLFDKILLSHANRCWNDIDMEKLITLTEEDVNVEVKEELKTGEKTKRIGF